MCEIIHFGICSFVLVLGDGKFVQCNYFTVVYKFVDYKTFFSSGNIEYFLDRWSIGLDVKGILGFTEK